MKRTLLPFIALLALGWTACPPPAPNAPPDPGQQPEASFEAAPVPLYDHSPCGNACSRLAEFDCEEATPSCAVTCTHILTTGLTPFSVDCITGSNTKTSVRLCPGIECKNVRSQTDQTGNDGGKGSALGDARGDGNG